ARSACLSPTMRTGRRNRRRSTSISTTRSAASAPPRATISARPREADMSTVQGTAGETCPRPLTGRTVLIVAIAFFATVSLVNAIMIGAAVTTFGGVETGSAYQAGQMFAGEIESARAQDARHWQVNADVRREGERALIAIDARGADGKPLAGLAAA